MKRQTLLIKTAALCLPVLLCCTFARAQSGVWTSDLAGNWSDIANWNAGVGPIADGAGNTADFSTINITAARTVTFDASHTLGHLIFGDTTPSHDWTIGLGADTILTLDAGAVKPTINVNYPSTARTVFIAPAVAGTSGLVKLGQGALRLLGTNTLTGDLIVNGGLLGIQYASVTYNTIPAANYLTLSDSAFDFRTGTFNVFQGFAGLTVDPGQSFLYVTRGSGGKGTYVLGGSSTTRNIGGTLDLPVFDAGRTIVGATNYVAGIVLDTGGVAYMTSGGYADWAGKETTANTLRGGGGMTKVNSTATSLTGTAEIATGVTLTTLAADTTITSLRNAINQATTINLGGFTLTAGGILMNATANTAGSSITNGTLRGPSGRDLVIIQNSPQAFTIGATIADNGSATALTRGAAGAGALILTGANTYSGATYINAGTLQVGAGGTTGDLGSSPAVFNNGTLTVNHSDTLTISAPISGRGALIQAGAGTLVLTADGSYTGNTTISAGTLQLGNGGGSGSVSNSAIINNAAMVFDRAGTFSRAVAISGTGSVAKNGSGTLVLQSANTYSGNTVINAGSVVLGPAGSVTNSAAIFVAAGAVFDVSAVSGFTLNGMVPINQTLAGVGAVKGSVATVIGTGLSPGGAGYGTLSFGNNLSLGGGTFAFNLATTNADQILVAGDLDLTAGTIALSSGDSLTNGTYTLIRYSGNKTGSAANIPVAGFSQPGQAAILVDTTPGQIDLVISAVAARNLKWAGDGAANQWNIGTTANWLNGAAPSVFHLYDNALLDDSTFNTTVDLAQPIFASEVVVNTASTYTLQTTAGGKLSGAASLTKQNSGTLTLLTLNDYSGPTTISGGTVQVGNGTTAGNLGSGETTNNAALIFNQPDNRTVNGGIHGTGTLTQQGAATLALARDNTYSGLTTINPGATLQVGLGAGSGTLGTGNVTDDGTLIFDRSGTFSYGGVVSGSGNVVKRGSSALTLTKAQTYGGATTIAGGKLVLGAAGVLPSGPDRGNVAVDGGETMGGTLDLNGFNAAINGLDGAAGTVPGRIANNSGSVTNVLTVGHFDAVGYSYAVIADNDGAGGKVALVKVGAGTQTLRGASTYSGGTTVTAGTLGLNHSAAAGTGGILLSPGATLSVTAAGTSADPSAFPANPVTTPAGAEATITSSQLANGYNSLFYGSPTSTNVIPGPVSCSVNNTKQFQNFLGTVRIPGGGQLRYSSTSLSVNGGDNTTFIVDGTLNTRNGTGTGAGIAIGALFGGGTLGGAGNADGNGVYVIGAKGIDSTFSGTISDAAARLASIIKVGAGTLTLEGTLSYAGTTTVSNGVLVVAGTAELDDSTAISVKAGAVLDVSGIGGTLNLGNTVAQTLSGAGIVRGSVVQNANSTINPGDSIGILTVTNAVSLSGTNIMELNRTNTPTSDRLVAESFTANAGAVLVITNIGPTNFTAGDTFQLFSKPVSGLTLVSVLPSLPCAGLQWTNKLDVDGTLAVIGSPCVSITPTNLVMAYSAGTVDLSWPESHRGWTLQTNAVDVANAAQWFPLPGSTAINRVILSVDTAKTNVFYRLNYLVQ